jgi:predicted ATPase with chaperone activity
MLFTELSKMQPGEPSEKIRERVIKARKVQEARFKDFKEKYCPYTSPKPSAIATSIVVTGQKERVISKRTHKTYL